MMDSRFQAMRLLGKDNWKLSRKLVLFCISFLVAFASTMLLDAGMSEAMRNTFFITVFAATLWLTEAIPPYIVGIMIIVSLVWFLGGQWFITEPISVDAYTKTWASPIVFLMLGGFFMAEGLRKTGLDQKLFITSTRLFGKSPKMILLGIMLTTALLSMLMSNTATTAMMVASVLPFLRSLSDKDPFRKSLLLGIPAAASIGGMGTIIGTPPNAIAVEFLKQNKGISIDFAHWMLYGVPVSMILIFIFWLCLNWLFRSEATEVRLQLEQEDTSTFSPQKRTQRPIVLITVAVTVGLWVTTPLHGLGPASIASIPILVFAISGIIGVEEFKSLSWDTLALVAGGLSLGAAITNTGLAAHFLEKLSFNPAKYEYLFYGFIALITIVMSNIMSNTATSSILIPVACNLFAVKSFEVALVISMSASCALFLPVSTPPNAVAFSTGLIQQKDFRLGGLLLGLVGPFTVILWLLIVR